MSGKGPEQHALALKISQGFEQVVGVRLNYNIGPFVILWSRWSYTDRKKRLHKKDRRYRKTPGQKCSSEGLFLNLIVIEK